MLLQAAIFSFVQFVSTIMVKNIISTTSVTAYLAPNCEIPANRKPFSTELQDKSHRKICYTLQSNVLAMLQNVAAIVAKSSRFYFVKHLMPICLAIILGIANNVTRGAIVHSTCFATGHCETSCTKNCSVRTARSDFYIRPTAEYELFCNLIGSLLDKY